MQISEGLRKIRLVKGTFKNQQAEDKHEPKKTHSFAIQLQAFSGLRVFK